MAAVVNYFEVGGADPAASRAFYGELFDWSFGPSSPAAYQSVNEGAGGLWDTTGLGGANWAIFYAQVDDVAAAIAHAEALGGTVAVPLVDNGQITFAHLVDPAGNRFGVWRPNR